MFPALFRTDDQTVITLQSISDSWERLALLSHDSSGRLESSKAEREVRECGQGRPSGNPRVEMRRIL